jgi:hypothetical protein
MVVSINLSRVVLQALRHEPLVRACNARGKVFDVLHDLHASLFVKFAATWYPPPLSAPPFAR